MVSFRNSENVALPRPKRLKLSHKAEEQPVIRGCKMTISQPHVMRIIAGQGEYREEVSLSKRFFENSGSRPLAAMVNEYWKEGIECTIDWSEMDPEVVKSALHFLEHGVYNKKTEEYKCSRGEAMGHVEVYIFADRYLLTDLEDVTVECLLGYLNGLKWYAEEGDDIHDIEEILMFIEYIGKYTDIFSTMDGPIPQILITSISTLLSLTWAAHEKFNEVFEDHPAMLAEIYREISRIKIDEAKELRQKVDNYHKTNKKMVVMCCNMCRELRYVSFGLVVENTEKDVDVGCHMCRYPLVTTVRGGLYSRSRGKR